jgi:hypothetical protein
MCKWHLLIDNEKHVLQDILVRPFERVPASGKKHSKLSYVLLILSKSKENVTLTWAAGVQNVLFVTITRDKFVIYVPIRKYGNHKHMKIYKL